MLFSCATQCAVSCLWRASADANGRHTPRWRVRGRHWRALILDLSIPEWNRHDHVNMEHM